MQLTSDSDGATSLAEPASHSGGLCLDEREYRVLVLSSQVQRDPARSTGDFKLPLAVPTGHWQCQGTTLRVD